MTIQESADNGADVPLNEMDTELEEDAYGYVDPCGHSRKISRDIMMQLPSHHLDTQDEPDSGQCISFCTLKRRRSLKRSETRYKTMKLKRVTIHSTNMDDDIDKVYELLTSDPDAEQEAIRTNLRELHQSLTLKRMVKAKIDCQKQSKRQLSSLNYCARLRYRIIMGWQHLKYGISDISYSLELWQGLIKKTQGHFGSGVASYFIFLRWLLCLNLFNFFISFGFIVTPQLIYESFRNVSDENVEPRVAFNGFDILTGSGWLGNSSFFYGHYTNETIDVAEGYYYDMPLAYFFTVGIAAIVNLIVVAYCTTKSYQTTYVDSTGPLKNKLSGRIFCAWDYTIEKLDTAVLQHRLIHNNLKELLSSELKAHRNENICKKFLKVLLCILVNIFVVFTTIGIGYLVYFILENKAVEVETEVLKNMTLALTVTSISLVFHYLISYATKLEFFFSKQLQLYLTLGRVAALRIVILSVLVYFWIAVPGPKDYRCSESLLGGEIYRLIIVNFLVNLIVCTILGEFLMKVMEKVLKNTAFSFIKSPEFDIAYNTNDLIYYQTLVWVGAFYSPMLPLLFLIILVVMFYTKIYSIKLNCRPPKKPWSAAQAQTVFLILTLMNLLLTGVAIGYIIFRVTPSTVCGPFRTWTTTYSTLLDWFAVSPEHGQFTTIAFQYLTSPGLPLSVVLCLCFAVYYARAYALANETIMKHVRRQLIIESKEKVYLLQLFDSAYREWKRCRNLKSSGSDMTDGNGDVSLFQSSDFSHDLINPIYKDYYLPTGDSSPLLSSPTKIKPGYFLADVSNVNNHVKMMHDLPQRNSPSSSFADMENFRNQRPSNCASPLSQERHEHDLIQHPVHKVGFRYLSQEEISKESVL